MYTYNEFDPIAKTDPYAKVHVSAISERRILLWSTDRQNLNKTRKFGQLLTSAQQHICP